MGVPAQMQQSRREMPSGEARSVASGNSSAGGATKKRRKNRNRTKKLKDANDASSTAQRNQPQSSAGKAKKKKSRNKGDGTSRTAVNLDSFQLPQIKIELRKVFLAHLRRYEKEIADLQQQVRLGKDRGAAEEVAEIENLSMLNNDELPVQNPESGLEQEATRNEENVGGSYKWLSQEQRLKQRAAYINCQSMMLLIRDLICCVNPNNSSTKCGEGLATQKMEEKSFWGSQNILFSLDQVSVQNALLELSHHPEATQQAPFSFPGEINDISTPSVVDQLADILAKVSLQQPQEVGKMGSANVHVRILSVVPPRKSRRRGEVSGVIYMILTPEPKSIVEEIRQQNIRCNKHRPHEMDMDIKPVMISPTAIPSTEKNDINELVESSLPGDFTKTERPTESAHLDVSKITAISRLVLDSAFDKLRSNSSVLSPSLSLITSPNQKTFPEPKYQQLTTEPTDQQSLHQNKPRRLRGEGRFENTLSKSDDYIDFLNIYNANEGRAPLILSDEQTAGKKNLTYATAATGGANIGPNEHGNGVPVAALVLHLQKKRKEEEEKKIMANQRKASSCKRVPHSTTSNGGKGRSSTAPVALAAKSAKSTTKINNGGGVKAGNKGGGKGGGSASKKKSSSATMVGTPITVIMTK